MMAQHEDAAATAQAIRDFIAVYDRHDPDDREVAAHVRILLQRELYRREREQYPEWVDVGGEGG